MTDLVVMDQDASIPARPSPYAGKPITTVTVKFTVELRDPVGRDVSAVSGSPAEGAAPAEGENPEGGQK